jgi:hypothetical protein
MGVIITALTHGVKVFAAGEQVKRNHLYMSRAKVSTGSI